MLCFQAQRRRSGGNREVWACGIWSACFVLPDNWPPRTGESVTYANIFSHFCYLYNIFCLSYLPRLVFVNVMNFTGVFDCIHVSVLCVCVCVCVCV